MLTIPRSDFRRYGEKSWEKASNIKRKCCCRAGAKVLGSITIGANTRIGAGSVVVRSVQGNSTVVGIPGRVVHQSGVKINPLAHSALPDAEANVIRNLMDRIDTLENQLNRLQKALHNLVNDEAIDISKLGDAQNLKDKEIIEFLGDDRN